MHEKFGAAIVIAAALVGCAQILGIEDLPGERCPSGRHCLYRCALYQDTCIENDCGDGLIHREAGEICDDGNTVSGDGCRSDCWSTEQCGNGYLDVAAGEVCDDGNWESGDGCSVNCKSIEVCGNEIVDVAVGEVCDDGNGNSGDGCNADCKLE